MIGEFRRGRDRGCSGGKRKENGGEGIKAVLNLAIFEKEE